MELFDIVKTIFKSDKDWKNVGRNDKVRNFFMINRIMSIQFPTQANQFNHTKILPRPVVDCNAFGCVENCINTFWNEETQSWGPMDIVTTPYPEDGHIYIWDFTKEEWVLNEG